MEEGEGDGQVGGHEKVMSGREIGTARNRELGRLERATVEMRATSWKCWMVVLVVVVLVAVVVAEVVVEVNSLVIVVLMVVVI